MTRDRAIKGALTSSPLVAHLLEGLALLFAVSDLGLDRDLLALQRAQLLVQRPPHLLVPESA